MSHSAGLSLADGAAVAGIDMPDLWLRYLALTGRAGIDDVTRWVHDDTAPDDLQHDLIAHAINEFFLDLGVLDPGADYPVAYRGRALDAHTLVRGTPNRAGPVDVVAGRAGQGRDARRSGARL